MRQQINPVIAFFQKNTFTVEDVFPQTICLLLQIRKINIERKYNFFESVSADLELLEEKLLRFCVNLEEKWENKIN